MPVKEIFVTLHRSRNPQVVLEERDQEAAEGDYIIWYLRRNEGGLKIWDFKADFENVFASLNDSVIFAQCLVVQWYLN